MVFVPMAQAPPKADAKEMLYSLNLVHEFAFTYIYIRVFNQPALCRFA